MFTYVHFHAVTVLSKEGVVIVFCIITIGIISVQDNTIIISVQVKFKDRDKIISCSFCYMTLLFEMNVHSVKTMPAQCLLAPATFVNTS